MLALTIICLAAFAVYSKVLNAPFTIDDMMCIVDSGKLKVLSSGSR